MYTIHVHTNFYKIVNYIDYLTQTISIIANACMGIDMPTHKYVFTHPLAG